MEKRKHKRVPIRLDLEISSLFRQNNEQIINVDAPIDVCNISRGGIGFVSKSELPVGFYFNARIQVDDRDDDSAFYCVVEIIRRQPAEDGRIEYGCQFIGFPSVLNYIFDELDKKEA